MGAGHLPRGSTRLDAQGSQSGPDWGDAEGLPWVCVPAPRSDGIVLVTGHSVHGRGTRHLTWLGWGPAASVGSDQVGVRGTRHSIVFEKSQAIPGAAAARAVWGPALPCGWRLLSCRQQKWARGRCSWGCVLPQLRPFSPPQPCSVSGMTGLQKAGRSRWGQPGTPA